MKRIAIFAVLALGAALVTETEAGLFRRHHRGGCGNSCGSCAPAAYSPCGSQCGPQQQTAYYAPADGQQPGQPAPGQPMQYQAQSAQPQTAQPRLAQPQATTSPAQNPFGNPSTDPTSNR
jgi:hypothetical protein